MEESFDIDCIRENAILVSSGVMKSYDTPLLNSKQRLEVHKMIESFPVLSSISLSVLGTQNKTIRISLNKKNIKSLELTPEGIKFFSQYARVPLPSCDPSLLDYYLGELDEFFDCKRFYSLFRDALMKNQLHELKSEASKIRAKIIEYIKSNDEFIKFSAMKNDIPTNILMKTKLYHNQNNEKYFVSIDVKSANYRVLRKFCPNLANTEWKEFISKFTDIEFLIESKYFREVIFGELGCSKILKLPLIFVSEVEKIITSDSILSGKMKKVFCSEDEIVYEVQEDFDTHSLEKNIEVILPNHFRVEKYKLSQIGNLSYFVREFSNKKDFKNVPKKFILQCLKFYNSKPITELDRKFDDDDGILATYDRDIFSIYQLK